MTRFPPTGRVYLTDGVLRRTVAATRALNRGGWAVTVGEEIAWNSAFFSRHCHQRHRYPSPRRDPDGFLAALLDYLTQHPHDCLIPMDQSTIDLILPHRADFERVTRLPFPDNERYALFRDKARTMALAAKIGLPHPRTICPQAIERVMEEVATLRFPVVIKARHGGASQGIRFVERPDQLIDAYLAIHQGDPFPLIQEVIPQGPKFYVAALFDFDSNPVATSAYRELRNYPLRHGPSTMQESVWRPDLVAHTIELLRAGGWVGAANADFMIDPRDGTPMLMEVNPRFWGPLQLCIRIGRNYPLWLAQLARGEQVTVPEGYELGLTCRALLPHDLMHFVRNPQRWQMRPAFFDFWNPKGGYDVLALEDPAATVGFFLSMAAYALEPETWIRLGRAERIAGWLGRLRGRNVVPPRVPSAVPIEQFFAPAAQDSTVPEPTIQD